MQGPRSYWDQPLRRAVVDHQGPHSSAPPTSSARLHERIAKDYPGTGLGVSEYFPGGCAHIASGLAVADTLGVFARMGVRLAALWQACARLEYAFGGLELFRNADGRGLRFAGHAVAVEHPERAQSSVYAGSDDRRRVTVVVINKTASTRRFGLRLFHAARLRKVAIYRIDARHASPASAGTTRLSERNAFAYTAPALSAALLVFTTR